jgi:hypothetical protein
LESEEFYSCVSELWIKTKDRSRLTYYYNAITREVKYAFPKSAFVMPLEMLKTVIKEYEEKKKKFETG